MHERVLWLHYIINPNVQEAILAIGSASTPIQFRDAVKSGLFFSLHNVVSREYFFSVKFYY